MSFLLREYTKRAGLLLGGLLIAFSAMVQSDAAGEENQKVRIAMAGTADDKILQLGLAAMRSTDSTRNSLEVVELSEKEALRALRLGQVGAVIVFPEGFMDDAMNGQIRPVKFITNAGSVGMVRIFKEEVSAVISSLLLESQKGVYGMAQAMEDQGVGSQGRHMTNLALVYTDYILARDDCYRLEELGISDDLGLEGYLLCGLTVVFLALACLPFAPLMIRRDLSLARMLESRGKPAWAQALVDALLYALGLTAVSALLLALAGLFSLPGERKVSALLPGLIPSALMVACFSFFLYTLSTDLISGILLQFFAGVSLCFVSGCIYPVFFFPLGVQRVAAWLPTGLARSLLAGCITGQSRGLWGVLAYSAVFLAAGVLIRTRAVKEARV